MSENTRHSNSARTIIRGWFLFTALAAAVSLYRLATIGDVSADHASGLDQRGASRAPVTMPGAYAGMDLAGGSQAANREKVTLTD